MRLTHLFAPLLVLGAIAAHDLSAQSRSDRSAIASPQFAPPVRLEAGGEYIDTGEHVAHAGPLAVDLNADGKLDLLVGNFRGHFQVYLNTGSRVEPEYISQGLLQADGATVKVPNW